MNFRRRTRTARPFRNTAPRVTLGLFFLSTGCIYGPLVQNELERAPSDGGELLVDADADASDLGTPSDVVLDVGAPLDAFDGDAGGTDLEVGEPDAGEEEVLSIPFAVDDHFPDRSLDGEMFAANHTEDNDCPRRAHANAVGLCHRIRWPGRRLFTNGYWTVGSDFVDLQAVRVEPGARFLQFSAWGRSGGELVQVGAGLGGNPLNLTFDDIEKRSTFEMSVTPQVFRVALTGLGNRTMVYCPFFIRLGQADNPNVQPEGLEFYVDDIQWVR